MCGSFLCCFNQPRGNRPGMDNTNPQQIQTATVEMNRALQKSLRGYKRMLIATYKVRSLTRDKQHQLLSGIAKYNIDAVALQEHRQRLEVELDYLFVPSGVIIRTSADSKGVGGIGIFMSCRLYMYL